MLGVGVIVVVALALGYVLRRSRNPRATGAFRRGNAAAPWMVLGDDGHSDRRDDGNGSHDAGDSSGGIVDSTDSGGDGSGGGGDGGSGGE